jgi:hypothetical protein
MVPEHYTQITTLKDEAKTEGINVYGSNYVSPEMIWLYGDVLPSIADDNDELHFPKDNRFGLLAREFTDTELQSIGELYNIDFVRTYDINMADSSSKKHNDRLVNTYYILTKK